MLRIEIDEEFNLKINQKCETVVLHLNKYDGWGNEITFEIDNLQEFKEDFNTAIDEASRLLVKIKAENAISRKKELQVEIDKLRDELESL